MQREVVMAPEHWTVGEAIDYLRAAEAICRTSSITCTGRSAPASRRQCDLGQADALDARRALRIIVEDVSRYSRHQDEGDVAYAFNQYHLISRPCR